MGLAGTVRGKPVRTTVGDKAAPCPLDRVNGSSGRRPRTSSGWQISHVATWSGFVYVAFVVEPKGSPDIDAFARRIVGWWVSRPAHAGFVLDVLEQALHKRRPVGGKLAHHSDKGVQGEFKWSSHRLSALIAALR